MTACSLGVLNLNNPNVNMISANGQKDQVLALLGLMKA